jgi:hypothetical protein
MRQRLSSLSFRQWHPTIFDTQTISVAFTQGKTTSLQDLRLYSTSAVRTVLDLVKTRILSGVTPDAKLRPCCTVFGGIRLKRLDTEAQKGSVSHINNDLETVAYSVTWLYPAPTLTIPYLIKLNLSEPTLLWGKPPLRWTLSTCLKASTEILGWPSGSSRAYPPLWSLLLISAVCSR